MFPFAINRDIVSQVVLPLSVDAMRPRRAVPGKYAVEAVAKALDVLEAFDHTTDLSLLEISHRVGLNKSRTFRLLHTLSERGYVERGFAGMHYKLGFKVLKRSATSDLKGSESSVSPNSIRQGQRVAAMCGTQSGARDCREC
jgi:IclR-like helix-turn-helix domain-containing protein